MYADDKPKDVAWYAAGEESLRDRVDSLERSRERDRELTAERFEPLERGKDGLQHRVSKLEGQMRKALTALAPLVVRVETIERHLTTDGAPIEGKISRLYRAESGVMDLGKRVQDIEAELTHLRPRRNEDPREITSTHPDAGNPDWFEPDGMTEQTKENIAKFKAAIDANRITEQVKDAEKRRLVKVGWQPSSTRAHRPEHNPPYRLVYFSGDNKVICETTDLTHAQGIAELYAKEIGVAIHCRDERGKFIFEALPGEKK